MTEGALISRALTHPSAVQICTQVILTEQYTRTWVSVKSASVGIIVWVLCVNVQHSFPWNMVYCVMVFETQGRGSYKSKFHFNVLTKDQIKHFNWRFYGGRQPKPNSWPHCAASSRLTLPSSLTAMRTSFKYIAEFAYAVPSLRKGLSVIASGLSFAPSAYNPTGLLILCKKRQASPYVFSHIYRLFKFDFQIFSHPSSSNGLFLN